jgi:hypothetical protein
MNPAPRFWAALAAIVAVAIRFCRKAWRFIGLVEQFGHDDAGQIKGGVQSIELHGL